MAKPTRHYAARALLRRFVRGQGGNPNSIVITAGTGLVVAVMTWTAPDGSTASISWSESTTQLADAARTAVGL